MKHFQDNTLSSSIKVKLGLDHLNSHAEILVPRLNPRFKLKPFCDNNNQKYELIANGSNGLSTCQQ